MTEMQLCTYCRKEKPAETLIVKKHLASTGRGCITRICPACRERRQAARQQRGTSNASA